MNLIFFGKSGSGKGTYAQYLMERYSFVKIATGDLLREEMKKRTKIGMAIEKTMNEGRFVEDSIAAEVLKRRLEKEDYRNSIILDGYPRSITQAHMLEDILSSLRIKIDYAINFDISDNTAIERLTSRLQCRKCGQIYNTKTMKPKKEGVCDKCGGGLFQREDDKKEAILKRLEEYKRTISPIIEYYKSKGMLKIINSDRERREVFKELEKLLSL